ncbi:MAG TPA: 2-phosphosulfolactate phosphatase [Dehalococcoidia bacterium]|jgi:2-phosphosulfolactate phosphatase
MLDDDVFTQGGFRCRLQWGRRGAREAAARGDIVVIVDVLRFSSAVATAVSRGGEIYPCAYAADVENLARTVDAQIAARGEGSSESPFSLSPRSYALLQPGTRVVLPSPNGAQCTLNASAAPYVFAGAIVNGDAVARVLEPLLTNSDAALTVIACGERWTTPSEDGDLRFAIEDLLGAGAILSGLSRHSQSPEARVAAGAFTRNRDDVREMLQDCASGRELRARGLDADVHDCAQVDSIDAVPVLCGAAYAAFAPG